MVICPHCGRENEGGARFCSSCGAELEDAERGGEVRKVVTVVFADLVGSTSLGERLDPETLRHVMARYFDAMEALVVRHGGTVEKFIGDAIVAVFGVPMLHEDDALRAVRAVAAMRDELARINEDLEREHGIRIEVRTGVNTGPVVAGDAAARQRLVTGDAVNVAARLEQAAGSGEILLGEATYRLVDELVRAEALEPLSLKGKSEALSAWRLLGLLDDVPAFTRPIAAPFVGRAPELAALEQAFERTGRERACALATIVGPPGIGKSRLARELVGLVSAGARVVVGRCLPYGEGITYWPLAEIVRQLAETDHDLMAMLGDDEQAELVAARVLGAIGAADGAGSPEETSWAFRRLFEALAHRRPLLIVVDDIHWAEPTLLDLLEYVLSFSSGAPILLLCLARPELFDNRPSWAAPRPNTTLVALAPLSENETEALIGELTRDLSGDAEARIVEAAEGNPLFVEQMLALQAEEPKGEVVVPPTIQALLAARIDRLPAEERAVVERASVEGRLFHRGAVSELLPATARAGIGTQLMSLVRKEFLRPDRSLFPGDDGLRFSHMLIRDAAYESMPKQLRAELHERYAQWLEQRGSADEYDEIVAYHLEQSYEARAALGQADSHAQTVAAKAGLLLAEAGRRALSRGDVRAAAGQLRRAAALLAVDPGARAEVLPDYGLALLEAGDMAGAERVLDEAIEQARQAGDARSELRAQIDRAWMFFFRGADAWNEQARHVAERAIAVFTELGDDGNLAGAWTLLGWVEGHAGRGDARIAALRRAREHARAAGDRRREMEIWVGLGGAMISARTPADELLAFGAEELAWAQEQRVPFLEADGSLLGVYVYPALGRFDEARELLARARSIFEEHGAAENTAETFWVGGQLELLEGDFAAAEREFREALRLTTEKGDAARSAFIKAQLARAVHGQGAEADAVELLRAAQDESVPGNYRSEVAWRTALGRLLAARGEGAEAARLAREAVDFVAKTDNISLHADALVDLAEVLLAQGEDGEAAEALEQAVALYDEKGYVLCADRARAVLASIPKARSGKARD